MVKRLAFTLVELVMVIVVLGIVASIGADIIASMYDNYLRTRTINRLQSQSEIALEQIAKRLQYRIKDSTIARNTSADTFLPLSDSGVDENFDVIEWIGYCNEAFRGTSTPLWTGLVDLGDTNRTNRENNKTGTIVSPGSNFNATANLMNALTNGDIDMIPGKEAALIFNHPTNISDFGWGTNVSGNTDGNNMLLAQITPGQPNILTIVRDNNNTLPTEISEHFYLAHTAYALAPIGNPTDFNLTLSYNYQPWLGEKYTDNNDTRRVLAEHVQLFRVRQDANLIRLKLCLHDNKETGTGDRIVTCKEKVVF